MEEKCPMRFIFQEIDETKRLKAEEVEIGLLKVVLITRCDNLS